MDTSIEVFAEFGYDGARVDEIAKRAGVNKSLIYYHFEGKEHLLKEMISNFFKKFEKVIRETIGDDEKIEMAFRHFINSEEPCIRIILIESLKNNKTVPPLFSMVEGLIKLEEEILGRKENEKVKKRIVAEFFVNMIPRAFYVCFKDSWCKHFDMEEDDLETTFYDVIVGVHSSYIRELF